MRGEIIKNVGHNDPALEWSFGQLLALATWIPVSVEWVYILICKFATYILAYKAEAKTIAVGLKRGLEGHVPQGYAVIVTGHTEAAQASQVHHNLPANTVDLCLCEQEAK
jgi:hypothetical protein